MISSPDSPGVNGEYGQRPAKWAGRAPAMSAARRSLAAASCEAARIEVGMGHLRAIHHSILTGIDQFADPRSIQRAIAAAREEISRKIILNPVYYGSAALR
jgi:hypothetical protein